MAESVRWLDDGTPESPRFGDLYRTRGLDGLGGLEQARHVFLRGCGLPEGWRNRPAFTVLETGFGLGLNFLATWAAWRADPERPRLLHYVATEAYPVSADDLRRSAAPWPELAALANALAERWWGVLPGTHRLRLGGGQVLLTLGVADSAAWLTGQRFLADAVFLDGFDPERNPDMWAPPLMEQLARHARPGARVATWTVASSVRDGLAHQGFSVEKADGLSPKRQRLQGRFAPSWAGHKPVAEPPTPGRVLVVGAGLSGASVAASLARRGCEVVVLDRADRPAAGASGLPAGLYGPHLSTDDAWLSQITRAGVRTTWQHLQDEPAMAGHWGATGVLERRVGRGRHWPHATSPAGADWTRTAAAETLAQASLPPNAPAWWHAQGGWVQPAHLVQALLGTPGVSWRGRMDIQRLRCEGSEWVLEDGEGRELERAGWVIVAAGPASRHLVPAPLPLHAVRGQVTGVLHGAQTPALPPFATNGHGALIPHVPTDEGPAWFCGSTFDRSRQEPQTDAADDTDNLTKLRELLPALGTACADSVTLKALRPWSGVRCTVPDRVPLVGPVDESAMPGLWASTAMGARGLSLALLCGELTAALRFNEPLPLDDKLARHLRASRFL